MSEAVGFTCAELPAEQYHADQAIGASMLEDFRESRRLYEGRYITKTIPPREPSAAMEMGTWIHARILEPDRYFENLGDPLPDVAPDGKKWLRRKGSDHEKWWAEEVEKRAGRLGIDLETREQIEAIALSVLSKPWAKPLLAGTGEPEYSIFWTDDETGLRLKCRVDWFRPIISIDLKTTGNASPAQFVKTCVSLGYHRKRAHYLAGIKEFTNDSRAKMVHLAVATTPPYSAGAYEIGDTDSRMNASLGLMEWRYDLRSLARCIQANDFSETWEREIMVLEYPAYAFTQSAYYG
jgi:hypothetical protein